jgi:GTPase SAR1 family protein
MSNDLPKEKCSKCVLVGPCQYGKTSFLAQLIKKTFDPQYSPTIGTDFAKYKLTKDHSLGIFDCTGHSGIMCLLSAYLRKANFVLIFVNPSLDGNDDWSTTFGKFLKSFSDIISPLYLNCEPNDIPHFAFICTHSDLPYVNISCLEELRTTFSANLKQNVPIFRVSSQNGDGIDNVVNDFFNSSHLSLGSHIIDPHVEVDTEEKEIRRKICTIL